MKNFTLCLLLLCGWATRAQLMISNTSQTPAQLVNNVLVDESIVPFNITFNGSAANANMINLRAAHFTTNFNPTNLGLNAGVMLATGNAQLGLGPNNTGNASDPVTPLYGGDPHLSALTTNTVTNSAVLEFDFVATGLEMKFDYIFASEEYPEFANSGFNDVFGFFLTGANPANAAAPYNGYNIAFVPNTNVPITINNVNNGTNNAGPCEYCTYYVNNGTGITPAANPHVQYDGFTTVLTAVANLVCGETYHMKIAIGNVGDNAYDSAVFLKDFRITPITLTANGWADPICPGLDVTLDSGVTAPGFVYKWYLGGVEIPGETQPTLVVPGTTYPALPVVEAGSFVVGQQYYINSTGTTDFTLIGAENNNIGTVFTATGPGAGTGEGLVVYPYSFEYYTAGGCLLGTATYALTYYPDVLKTPLPINLCTSNPPPYNFGNIDQTLFMLDNQSAMNYDSIYYYNDPAQLTLPVPPPGLTAAQLANYTTNNASETIYVRFEEVTAGACVTVKSFTLTAGLDPSGSFSYPPSYCISLPLQPITSTVTPGGIFSATPPGLDIDPATGQINPSLSVPQAYLVDYLLPAAGGCSELRIDDVPILITAAPVAPSVPALLEYCQGETVPALPNASTYRWYTSATGGTASTTPQPINTTTAGTYYYYVSEDNGCEGPRATIEVIVKPKPAPPAVTPIPDYCQGAVATPLANVTGSGLRYYTGPADLVGSTTPPTPSTAVAGTVYYEVTQTVPAVNGCESDRAIVQVNTVALPAAPSVSVPALGYCQGVAAPDLSGVVTGTNLLWYTAAAGGVGSPTAPVPATASTGITNYWVSQTNAANCEGPRAQISVEVFAIPSAPAYTVTPPDCTVNTATIAITPQGANSEYSIDNGATFQTANTFNAVPAGMTYDLVVRNALSQCISPAVSVNVIAAPLIPAAPVAVATAPDCNTPVSQITVQSPLGANLEYTIDGGATYQSSVDFTALAPNAVYMIAVRDAVNGCTSPATAVTVLPIPADPLAPAFTQIEPNCDIATGTVTITSVAANLEYSMDNGLTYQPSASFTGLAAGSSVDLVVRDTTTGCSSGATSVNIGPIPANPATPTATADVLVCGSNTSGFVVNSPIGPGFEYSIDGGASYQTATSFANLPTGASYNLTVRDMTTRCVSAPQVVVIAPALAVPAAPVTTETQPDCYAPTGSISIAPMGANISYSIDGGATFQTSPVFSSLAPNTTYNVVVRNDASGCLSAIVTRSIDPLPAAPAVPTAQITQPLCSTPTGSITVQGPLGANFEYSIDGGLTYQTTTVFSSLAPNVTYNLTVRDVVTGCSSVSVQTVNPIPGNPAAPTGAVSAPTCTDPTGTITIANPLGAQLEYSIDGVSYQANTVFANLAAGASYTIIVRNTMTGCISAPGTFAIAPAPTFPATPIALGADVCQGDSISLSTAAVAGATYSWTGPNGFASAQQNPVIANADASMSGTYSVIIETTANCPSLPGSVAIVVNPLPLPTLPQDGNICYNAATGAVLDSFAMNTGLSDAQYDFEWYVESGGAYTQIVGQTLSSYSVSVPGNYGVIAIDSVTGCVSDMVMASVDMTSPPLAIEVAASDYFDQSQTIAVTVSPAGDYEYQLDNGAFQPGNVFTGVLPGDHTVRVRNVCGTIEGVAFLMDYPKFFTPNGDGYNDTWNIFALKGQANAKIYIFDRYGKLLKQISPDGKGWDGTFNQNILPATDYWFSVHYEEDNVSKVFKSHFALKR